MAAGKTPSERKTPDPFGRGLEVLLGVLVGLMGGRICWRGLVEGFDLERILGGGVMLAAAIGLAVHAIRRGKKSETPKAA
jgi:hypothetical protein